MSSKLEYWKERCRAGKEIPRSAIVKHKLTDWFLFMPLDENRDVHLAFAEATGEVVTEWEWIDPETGEKDRDHIYRKDASGAFLRYPRMGDG